MTAELGCCILNILKFYKVNLLIFTLFVPNVQ